MHRTHTHINRVAALVLDGTGAVYHRVSTDHQDAERQRIGTADWLNRNGLTVDHKHVFEDQGWGRGDAERRPAWQKLLSMADAGRIQWILVDRQDRAESRDPYETAATIHRLRVAGCKLLTIDGRDLTADDIGSIIQTVAASDTSRRELLEKAHRVIDGKKKRAKDGEWQGGKLPYGMDVVAFRMDKGGDLHEQWRVQLVSRQLRIKLHPDGTRKDYHGNRNWPASDEGEILQLRPTLDPAALATVRDIYRRMDTEATTPGTIARQLNTEGVQPPAYSRQWQPNTVAMILTNPVYTGHPRWNGTTQGDYAAIIDGQEVTKSRGAKTQRQKRADWILSEEQLFEPVVDKDMWERVQRKMDGRTSAPRAPKSGYVFGGLVYCANCGAVMTGAKMPTRGIPAAQWPLTYICSTYNNHKGDRAKCGCKAFRIHQQQLHEVVGQYLEDTGGVVGDMSAAMKSKRPQALTDAIKKAVETYEQALDRVGGWRDGGWINLPINDDTGGDFAVMPEGPDGVAALARLAKRIHNDERHELENRKDELEAELDKLAEAWTSLPTPRAKERAKGKMEEVEAELDRIDHQLEDVGSRLEQDAREVVEMQTAWEEATAALSAETGSRQQAEAVRKVIGRITVRFKHTGKPWPVGVVESIDIEARERVTEGETQRFSGGASQTPSP